MSDGGDYGGDHDHDDHDDHDNHDGGDDHDGDRDRDYGDYDGNYDDDDGYGNYGYGYDDYGYDGYDEYGYNDLVRLRRAIDECMAIKLMPQDMISRVPNWVQEDFGDRIDSTEPIDLSGDGMIEDPNYNHFVGGFSVTDMDDMFRWLAIGTGRSWDGESCKKRRINDGDAVAFYKREADEIRIMDVYRIIHPDTIKKLRHHHVDGPVYRLDQISFYPGAHSLKEALQNSARSMRAFDAPDAADRRIIRLLNDIMQTNSNNVLFVHKYFPEHMQALDASVQQCILKLPFLMHRLPANLMRPETLAAIRRDGQDYMLPPYIWFSDDFETIMAMAPTMPVVCFQYISERFGSDHMHMLINHMVGVNPESLMRVPVALHNKKRINTWLSWRRSVTDRESIQWQWRHWTPCRDHMCLAPFIECMELCNTIPQYSNSFDETVPAGWWTDRLANRLADAYVTRIYSLEDVPIKFLTETRIKARLAANKSYSSVPKDLRTPELDAFAIFECKSSAHQNYASCTNPTLDMTRFALSHYGHYGKDILDAIPPDHLEHVLELFTNSFVMLYLKHMYHAAENLPRVLQRLDEIACKRGLLMDVPPERLSEFTDAMFMSAHISDFRFFPEHIRRARKTASTKYNNAQRNGRISPIDFVPDDIKQMRRETACT